MNSQLHKVKQQQKLQLNSSTNAIALTTRENAIAPATHAQMRSHLPIKHQKSAIDSIATEKISDSVGHANKVTGKWGTGN